MDVSNRESSPDFSSSSSPTGAATRMKQNIADRASNAKDSINELGRKTVDRLGESRETAANVLEKTADSLHSGTDQFSDMGHYAAERVKASADYVRGIDFDNIIGDLQNFVRRYPARSLAGAAILGFLVARGLSRSTR